ncbi:hypothetical protein ABPG72_020074 [Tetrahymena utriculariae]
MITYKYQNEKLQIIEIKFKCLVDQQSLIQIIEEPLADHIIMRKIALAVNNKRRTQKLKTQIKKKINLSDDAKQQQVRIINQFLNNIDSVKNHNKIKSTPTKSAQKEALPKVKGQQITNQNNQIINNLSDKLHSEIHSILLMQSNNESQYIENAQLSIQSQLLKSIESISPNQTLELNPDGPKQENIFYASDIHPNETYLLKLIQRVSCQEKDKLNLNIYISHRIAQDIYFKNLKDIINNPILFNTILQNLFEVSTQIKERISVWCEKLKQVDDNDFSNFYIALLIPLKEEHHSQYSVRKKMTYLFKTGLEDQDIQINFQIIQNKIKNNIKNM